MQFLYGTSATSLSDLGSPVTTNAEGVATSEAVTGIAPGTTVYAQATFAGDTSKGLNPFSTPVQSFVVFGDTTISLTMASSG